MKIQYYYSRYMNPSYADCKSVQDAIGMAWADLENGDAWPTKITSDDQVLWDSAALATTESLVKFAKEWGMELPY